MSIKKRFVALRDGYVSRQVQRAVLPAFSEGETERWQVVFSGRVQKVGFRQELCEMAQRLTVTGWCENMENGSVLAQLQGTGEELKFLVAFMESLKRIRITEKQVEKIAPVLGENEFIRR